VGVRGLAAVDQYPGQDRVIQPGTLGTVAGVHQLVAEVHGIDQGLVSGKVLADREQLVRGEVHVLIVHDDNSSKIRHQVRAAPQLKSPTSPGGR
jgi:hypothetical protein